MFYCVIVACNHKPTSLAGATTTTLSKLHSLNSQLPLAIIPHSVYTNYSETINYPTGVLSCFTKNSYYNEKLMIKINLEEEDFLSSAALTGIIQCEQY